MSQLFKNLSVILITLYCLQGCSFFESGELQAKRLSETYHIEIKAGDPLLFYPKGYTAEDAILEEQEFLSTTLEKAPEALDAIEQALGVYPPGFVASHLDAIYIAGTIYGDGAKAGGTYGPSWIVLASEPDRNGTGINFKNNLYAIHHEFSSIIAAKSVFGKISWGNLMPDGWEPAASNNEALTSPKYEHFDYSAGFLNGYGMTSVGNDLNVYAEYIFTEPNRVAELAAKYPIIAKKLGIFISIYTDVDPRFSDYFDKYGLTNVAKPVDDVEITLSIDTNSIKPTLVK